MAVRNTRKRNRNDKRRRRPGCLVLLFFAVLLIVAVVSVIFIFFSVKSIAVSGTDRYTETRVASASGVDTGDNLIFINKYTVSRRIMSELPYISEVSITRTLPDTLVVAVVEHTAVAYLESGDSFWLISSNGKLLERATERPQNIALIAGVSPILPVEGSIASLGTDGGTKLQTIADTLAALERKGMTGDVSEIGIGGVYDVTFEYLGRFTVKLGAPEDFDYKLEYLLKIVHDELQPNENGTLDLSRLIESGEARFQARK